MQMGLLRNRAFAALLKGLGFPKTGLCDMSLHIHSVENRRSRIQPVPNRVAPPAKGVYLFLNQGYTVAANLPCSWVAGPAHFPVGPLRAVAPKGVPVFLSHQRDA